jgi:aminoglycoside phosphotransferase family enzyme
MQDRVLIINGVVSTDELSKLGIEVAKEFSEADKVFIIDIKGFARQVKYSCKENLSSVKYIDASVMRRKQTNPV